MAERQSVQWQPSRDGPIAHEHVRLSTQQPPKPQFQTSKPLTNRTDPRAASIAAIRMNDALGILEVTGLTPAMVALDVMDKSASIVVLQTESNDFYGVVIKITGSQDSVATAIAAGQQTAERMGGKPVVSVLSRPDQRAWPALESKVEVSPLIQQAIVKTPRRRASNGEEQAAVAEEAFALGFIETQGFTAVFEAIDSACKAANVEVVGKEKLGGGYITVVIKGDVAAVKAAVEAGVAKVNGLGKLIAGHVIARPSAAVLSLLPKL
jgi:microcompartment protein CcmL/EutN